MATAIHKVEAKYYVPEEWDQVSCRLCPHLCAIAPSRLGICGVRFNRNGVLYADSYAKLARIEVVASEELPLFHYRPGARWLRAGMKGCNLRCPFCTTHQLSQTGAVRTEFVPPEELVDRAVAAGVIGIAFGVNEPLVAFEYVADVFRIARERQLDTFIETNGSWLEDPLHELLELTTAMSVGFKEFDEKFLNGECGGDLSYAKRTVEMARSKRVRIETSFVIIDHHPNWMVRARHFAEWLAGIGEDIPCTLRPLKSAFMWDGLEAHNSSVMQAREVMREHLRYLYTASAPDQKTLCACGHLLISRDGTTPTADQSGAFCPKCGAKSPVKL